MSLTYFLRQPLRDQNTLPLRSPLLSQLYYKQQNAIGCRIHTLVPLNLLIVSQPSDLQGLSAQRSNRTHHGFVRDRREAVTHHLVPPAGHSLTNHSK